MSPRATRSGIALLLPSAAVYAFVLVVPLAFLLRASLLPPGPGAPLHGPVSIDSYRALLDPYTLGIFARTVRIAVVTTFLCLMLGYPLALSLSRSTGGWRKAQLLMILSPLFVSVVVRSYGWVLLLGNRGIVNRVLVATGIVSEPVRILYTEAAVVIALVEALLPFMALSIAAVLERLPSELTDAARSLGASRWTALVHVTLPLSLPGVLSGSVLVFMVSMGAYATPALLGGSRVRVVVTEIYTQATSVFNWPLAAALAIALLALALVLGALPRGRTT